jgi:hypothetical protein
MSNNLHISYDLISPGQNYEKVIARIKELGDWAKIHASFWYVNSNYTASQAVDHIKGSMDANDKVYVVDATNNNAAWNQLSPEVAEHIKGHWAQ